jgi:small subunit ribosomal protein S6
MKVDNWGKRRLAYEVSKERKGIYLYWLYLGNPGVVEEIERNLRMLDGVLRYLTVRVDDNIDVGARPSEIDDAAYEKAATTAADEEDMFLTRGGEGEGPDTLSDDDDEDDFVYVEGGNKKKEPAAEPAAPAAAPAAAEGDAEEKE